MTDSGEKNYETPEILSDLPLAGAGDKAHFHFDAYAATLARLIASKNTLTPLAIGISGPWGSGKTTLLRRLQRQLDQPLLISGSRILVSDTFSDPRDFQTPWGRLPS